MVRGQRRRFRAGPGRQSRACTGRSKASLAVVRMQSQLSGEPARRFKSFQYATLDSWSRQRRVVAKAEWTEGEANPRYVVTTLGRRKRSRATSTRRSIALAATWRTGSRKARAISSPTAPPARPCAPTSSACGSPPWPTFCSAPCAASHSSTPSSRGRTAAPSVWRCSRSAPRHRHRPTHQVRHGLRLSIPARVPPRPRLAHRGHGPLTNQTPHSSHSPRPAPLLDGDRRSAPATMPKGPRKPTAPSLPADQSLPTVPERPDQSIG